MTVLPQCADRATTRHSIFREHLSQHRYGSQQHRFSTARTFSIRASVTTRSTLAPARFLTVNTQLPGNPNANHHTRFTPYLIRMPDGVIAFVATRIRWEHPPPTGIFTYGPARLQNLGGQWTPCRGSALIRTSSFNSAWLAVGAIAFRATDASADALFIAAEEPLRE
jgi:hypothetical protein